MNTPTRTRPLFFVFAALVIFALATTACSFHGPSLGAVSSLIDVTLAQEMFDQISPDAEIHLGDGCEPLDKIERIELHDGFIRFEGTRTRPFRAAMAGSFDLRLDAKDGMLTAEIISVDIPGMDLDDGCIADANLHMAVDLSRLMTDPQGEVLFKEVKVEEGALRMKVQVNVDL